MNAANTQTSTPAPLAARPGSVGWKPNLRVAVMLALCYGAFWYDLGFSRFLLGVIALSFPYFLVVAMMAESAFFGTNWDDPSPNASGSATPEDSR